MPNLKNEPRETTGGLFARFFNLPTVTLALLGCGLLWFSQPPVGLSYAAWFAVVPWLVIAERDSLSRREWLAFFFIAMGYWTLTMQGIRHAHPAMYATLALFAFYLACYSWLLVTLVRKARGYLFGRRSRPLDYWIIVPVLGTGLECIRNYLLTGVSAVMIGHTQADHPALIQIADAFGSYGVTFLVLMVNGAIFDGLNQKGVSRWIGLSVAASAMVLTIGYGTWRLREGDVVVKESQSPVANVMLVGRDEEIVFIQDQKRELEIFNGYFRQSIEGASDLAKDGKQVDVVVWPESMFNGSLPWLLLDSPTREQMETMPADELELISIIQNNRSQFQRRAAQVQSAIRIATGQARDPHLIVGCSVVRYQDPPKVHSSIVHVGEHGEVLDWYGKTHLVMFGEYIPLIKYLPFLHRLVPPGMGIEPGTGPMIMKVNDAKLAPNVCIETAVERVAVNHVRALAKEKNSPDAIVNVTNDGWFDRSSIVAHHLRCSQFVAVTSRTSVLISANGGPTSWIDSSGRIVERLANDASGVVLATVNADDRQGLYFLIGDWPARFMAVMCLIVMGSFFTGRKRAREGFSIAGEV